MALAYMANGSSTGKVYVIDVSSDKLLNPTAGITVGNVPYGVAFTPDGSQAVVTNWHHDDPGTAGTISFINTTTGAVVATTSPGGLPNGVAIAQNGSNLYAYVAVEDSNSPNNTDWVAIYDLATYTLVTTLTIGAGAMPHGVAATPDNNYVYIADGNDNASGPGQITIIDTSTNTITHTFTISASNYTSYGIAISPTGSPPRCFVTLVHGSTGNGTVAYFPADGSSHTLASISYVNVGVVPTGIATDGSMVYVATSNDDKLYYSSLTVRG
jgi:DNA-binding beta-propeller fold protein YncE